jgi:osmotically-inducible protein OsmY
MGQTREQIMSDLVSLLAADGQIDTSRLDVTVEDDAVRLSGVVDAQWQETYISNLLAADPRFAALSLELRVGDGLRFADRDTQLAAEIIGLLSSNAMLRSENVAVRVTGGEVTLAGTVPNEPARRALRTAVQMIAGVVEVRDELVTVHPPSQP